MLEPIPFWGMIEVDLPVKTYAGNKINNVKECMNKPVAWMLKTGHGTKILEVKPYCEVDYWIPLYTHPVKELTDEEIYRLLADSIWAVGLNTDCLDEQNWADGITVARAILRKAQE